MVITVCVVTGRETMGTIVPVLMAVVDVTELAIKSIINRNTFKLCTQTTS